MPRARRARGAALLAAAALTLTACSGDEAERSSQTPAAGTDAPTAQAQRTDHVTPPTPSPTTSPPPRTTPARTSAATTADAPSSPATTPPGGITGAAALRTAGVLGDDGRVVLGSLDAADPPLDALCAYVFGTAPEVGQAGRLAPGVELAATSGLRAEDDQVNVLCLYRVDGHPALALQITTGPPVDRSLPGTPIVVADGGVQAVLSYAPDFDGPRITRQDARAWLGHAVRLTDGAAS